MFNAGNTDLQARSAYLDEMKEAVARTLFSDDYLGAAGLESAVEMEKTNRSLFIPDYRDGAIELPAEYVNTEAVPFLALDPNDRYRIGASLAALTLGQQSRLSEAVSQLTDDHREQQAASIAISDGIAQHSLEEPAYAMFSTDTRAEVTSYSAPTEPYNYKDGQQLTYGRMVISGRPIIMMQYLPRKASHASLFYSLIMARNILRNPAMLENENPVVAQAADVELNLRANHLAALYTTGVINNPRLGDVWMSEVSSYATIEVARKQHADPNRPYKVTPELLIALRKLGVTWL